MFILMLSLKVSSHEEGREERSDLPLQQIYYLIRLLGRWRKKRGKLLWKSPSIPVLWQH